MHMIEYCISSLNRDKLFKELVKITKITNVRINDNKIRFCIPQKFKKNVDTILYKKNTKVYYCHKRGIIVLLKQTLFRIGVILPIVFFCIINLILNNFVFRLEIMGLQRLEKEKIINKLYENNYKQISIKNNIDINKIQEIIGNIDGISFVSAIVHGNTVIVNIKENLYNAEYDEKAGFKPLVSTINGRITEISIVQGNAKVGVGDIIKVGDVLVSPTIQDTSGNSLMVKPVATINADIYYTLSVSVANTFVEEIETGKFITSKKILMGKAIIFDQNNIPKYNAYKVFEEVYELSNNNILPLKEIVTTYKEIEYVENKNYFEDKKEQIIEELKQKTRQMVRSYDIIKDEYCSITSLCDINTITYTVLASGSAL